MNELSTVRDVKGLSSASGQTFTSVLVVKRCTVKTAGNGNPFLSVELGDRTGSFSSTVFSDNPAFESLKAAVEGSVLRIEAKVDHYQGRLAPRPLRKATLRSPRRSNPRRN